MSLFFLHGGIALAGLAAATLPVIIHLLLKQRPKPVIFPALQLIRKRHTSTVRRLRLQHLLLLALRIALILFLALALARPTLKSKLFGMEPHAPVAAAFVFDNSLSMGYVQRGKTRLEEAKELAVRAMNRLPENSQITLLESGNAVPSVSLDVPAAIGRLKTIELSPISRPLNQAALLACRSLAKATQERREIYFFTDLTTSSWTLSDAAQQELDQATQLLETGVRMYVINVGVDKPENISLGEVQLSQQVLPANSELTLTVTTANAGPQADRALKMIVDGEVRDTKPISLPAGQATELTFKLIAPAEGFHQGRLEINAADPLAFDDQRFFSFEVRPPVQVLAVADEKLDALNWTNALAPAVLQAQRRARYQVKTITERELAGENLSSYAVVALFNVAAPTPDTWNRLGTFVQAGGGLFVALGDRVAPVAYNADLAQTILPGKVADLPTKLKAETHLAPDKFTHSVLAKFREFGSTDMPTHPILAYWKLKPAAKGASVIIPYTNGDPALVERTFGEGKRGRSMLLTSPARYQPGDTWTEFPLSWSFVVLADQVTRYMAGIMETKLNFAAGSPVAIDLDPGAGYTLFAITDPAKQVDRVSVEPRETMLTVPSVRRLGHYQVESSAEPGKQFRRGFSVNEPPEESVLTTIDVEKLKTVIGKDRFAIARDPDALESVVDEARVGRELFSWIMLLVITLVCIEGYVANRFYRRPTLQPQMA